MPLQSLKKGEYLLSFLIMILLFHVWCLSGHPGKVIFVVLGKTHSGLRMFFLFSLPRIPYLYISMWHMR